MSSPADRLSAVLAAIEGRQDELFHLLGTLVGFETPSPPARNTALAQEWMARYLGRLGFTVDTWELYPGDVVLAATLPGSQRDVNRSLAVNGHIDVAEVGDAAHWARPPFTLTRAGDRLNGRGVADMKGGLAAALFAIEMLREAGVELRGDLVVQSVTGEEVGEAGTLSALERGHTADFAVIADTSDLHLQGQGGVVTGWITVESPQTFHDGMRARMIHAGGGVRGASAIEKMVKLIAALQELERHWAVVKSHPGFPPGMNTINPAVIEGGRHAAFVADRCALWITVHYYPDETHEEVAREIEECLLAAAAADPWLREHPPTFRWGGRSMVEERGEVFPSLAIDPDHPAMRQLATCFREVTGVDATIDMSSTVTDGGWFGHAGIPAVIFGPGQLAEAHAVDESVDAGQLVTYAQVMARFIAGWCNTPR
jgi:acetylornithine deacetylase